MSTRFAKQFLYATFYLVLWILFFGAIYGLFFRPVASCFDGKQDQGETGVDCGGPCATACTMGVQPPAVLGVNVFATSPTTETFLAQIANTNANLAAQYFEFSFELVNASGTVLQSFPGASFLYNNEVKYVALVNQPVGSTTAASDASATWILAIPTSTTEWVASSSFGPAPLLTVENVATVVSSSTAGATGSVLATGEVANSDTITFTNIFVIAVFKDANGNPIAASQTEIDSVAPDQTEPFSVSYPAIAGINTAATEVQAYAER